MRLNKINILFLTFFMMNLGQTNPGFITFTIVERDPYTQEVNINFTNAKKDFMYKDFITCSVDNPAINISAWKTNKQSIAHYDSSFKEAKQVFNENFTITMLVTKKDRQQPLIEPVHVYCSYYRKSEKKINHLLIPLHFTVPTQAQQYDTNPIEIIENDPTPTIKQKLNLLDYYITRTNNIIRLIVSSFYTDRKKYFALFIFLIIVFISFLYFFKQELKNHIKIKELIEIITSSLIVVNIAYILMHVHIISTPLITMPLTWFYSLCAGFFYIKKSIQLRSAKLCNLCTFIGIIFICGVLFLSFKLLQYTDDKFNIL